MNEGNVAKATQGLVNYLQKSFPGQAPRVVFAHDTRFFSREFAELAARTVAAAGGTAYLFSEDRSTPELSFAVRHLGAQAGVEITASHNPSHDNGYKAYFSDVRAQLRSLPDMLHLSLQQSVGNMGAQLLMM